MSRSCRHVPTAALLTAALAGLSAAAGGPAAAAPPVAPAIDRSLQCSNPVPVGGPTPGPLACRSAFSYSGIVPHTVDVGGWGTTDATTGWEVGPRTVRLTDPQGRLVCSRTVPWVGDPVPPCRLDAQGRYVLRLVGHVKPGGAVRIWMRSSPR